MARRDDLQEVELVEDDDVAPALPPGIPWRAVARRLPWRRLVAGAVVVAVAVGMSQWVAATREAAAVARLADLPGVLAPVDDHLTVGRPVAREDLGSLAVTSGGAVDRDA